MGSTMQQEGRELVSQKDKDAGMSDTAFYSGMMRDAFPRDRYGNAKAAIYAAYRYISPKVSKEFTERRARAIWEGAAKRIDAEEADALRQAQIEESKREYKELQDRLASLEASLAVADASFHGPQMDAYRSASSPMGKLDRSRTEG